MAPSLRGKLLRWLLVPLGILWLADAVGTYLATQRSVNSAADRSLYAAVLSISERVTVAGGQPVVDIPPMALEVLDTDTQERIFYKVSYQVGDGPVTYLTGYADLPTPPEDEEEQALAVNPADDQAATASPEPAAVVARLRPPVADPDLRGLRLPRLPDPHRHAPDRLRHRAAHRGAGAGGRDAGRAERPDARDGLPRDVGAGGGHPAGRRLGLVRRLPGGSAAGQALRRGDAPLGRPTSRRWSRPRCRARWCRWWRR